MVLEKIKYPSLNGLRAISVIIVILDHLGDTGRLPFFKSDNLNNEFHIWTPICYLLQNGQTGVNTFFVISGFLITSLLLKEEKNTSKISLKHFWIKRVLRIFPALYFLLLFYFVLQCFGIIHIAKITWIAALTYTTNLYGIYNASWLTVHLWSLSIEEIFYLFWPVCFLLGRQMRKYCCFFIVVFVYLFRFYVHRHPIAGIDDHFIFVRIDAIAIGCLIALYNDQILAVFTNNSYLKWLSFLAIVLLLLMPYARLGSSIGLVATLSISIILIYSVWGSQGSLWYRLLNSKIMDYIGKLSYSLYLWQQFFTFNPNSHWINRFPQNLIFIFIAGLFSYYFIEKLFLRLYKRQNETSAFLKRNVNF